MTHILWPEPTKKEVWKGEGGERERSEREQEAQCLIKGNDSPSYDIMSMQLN